MEPVSPALAGRVPSTVPPGKLYFSFFENTLTLSLICVQPCARCRDGAAYICDLNKVLADMKFWLKSKTLSKQMKYLQRVSTCYEENKTR